MMIEIRVPEMGESVIEATVTRWMKQEGESVAPGEAVVELETDKVNLEVSAPQAGVLRRILRRAGETVKLGEALAELDPTANADDAAPPPSAALTASPVDSPAPAVPVTPVARRMAGELGVDLAQVAPSGKRITRQDVQAYVAAAQPAAEAPRLAPAQAPAPTVTGQPAERQPAPAAAPSNSLAETRIRMSRRRQTIARRLVEAQHTAAMLTTFNEIDMTAVIAMRKRRREAFKERHGVDLGFMSFFVKGVVAALKAFPYLNAEIQDSPQGSEIVLKHYYDIGIAVGAEEGLVVPVLRGADRLAFAEIERKIRAFIDKVKNGSLSLDDLRGGTFTITNGGVYGSLLSTPILNPPQVGILGMHRIQERPVVVDGQIVARPMMYVALSYDHRIVDGREAVQFLVRVKELLEDPESLLLE